MHSAAYCNPSSNDNPSLLCPDKTRQYDPPSAAVIRIHSFCRVICASRNFLSGCVKSGEQHNMGITFPCCSTSFLNRNQLRSSSIPIKPAYHSSPSTSSGVANRIHSETVIVPSLHRACMKAFGNAASLGIPQCVNVLMC